MTFEELRKLNLQQILGRFTALQKRHNKLVLAWRRRQKAQRELEDLTNMEIIKGNVIPLYYRDEFTGIHYRSSNYAKYILHNTPDDAA